MAADLFGGTKLGRSSGHDTQLRFLMVCYSAPLMITGIASIVYYVSNMIRIAPSDTTEADDESPFS